MLNRPIPHATALYDFWLCLLKLSTFAADFVGSKG